MGIIFISLFITHIMYVIPWAWTSYKNMDPLGCLNYICMVCMLVQFLGNFVVLVSSMFHWILLSSYYYCFLCVSLSSLFHIFYLVWFRPGFCQPCSDSRVKWCGYHSSGCLSSCHVPGPQVGHDIRGLFWPIWN